MDQYMTGSHACLVFASELQCILAGMSSQGVIKLSPLFGCSSARKILRLQSPVPHRVARYPRDGDVLGLVSSTGICCTNDITWTTCFFSCRPYA